MYLSNFCLIKSNRQLGKTFIDLIIIKCGQQTRPGSMGSQWKRFPVLFACSKKRLNWVVLLSRSKKSRHCVTVDVT